MDQATAVVTSSVDRETLYDEIWTHPITKVAARRGVSSSFLARVCARLNIPRPPRGYWAQLEVGRAPAKPDLPSARPGDPLEWSRDRSLPRIARGVAEAPPAPKVTRARRSPRSARHEVLAGAREHFEAAKELDGGYLRPAKRRIVDLFVSRESLDRALGLASSLFLALENGGHRVAFAPYGSFGRPAVDERIDGGRDRGGYGSWSPDRPTVAYVGSVAIGLTLFELSQEVEMRYVDGKYVRVSELPLSERLGRRSQYTWTTQRHMPTGRLCLRASSPQAGVTWEQQWREAKKGDLRGRIQGIVSELEAASPKIATLVEEAERQAEIRRREWEIQQEKWRREAEERRRAQNIKDSHDQLFEIIEAWGVATRIEAFFDDIERRSLDAPAGDRQALHARVAAARSLLGGVDALERFATWKSPSER